MLVSSTCSAEPTFFSLSPIMDDEEHRKRLLSDPEGGEEIDDSYPPSYHSGERHSKAQSRWMALLVPRRRQKIILVLPLLILPFRSVFILLRWHRKGAEVLCGRARTPPDSLVTADSGITEPYPFPFSNPGCAEAWLGRVESSVSQAAGARSETHGAVVGAIQSYEDRSAGTLGKDS